MGDFFGTDGIRGEAGIYPLDLPTIERIGYSLARHLNAQANRAAMIVIGRDTRESGIWIEQAISRGIAAGGAQSISAGVITTPGVAFLTRDLKADAGVVISASHNPFQDNGIKIFSPTGRKLSDQMEAAIEEDLNNESFALPDSSTSREGTAVDASLAEKYLAYLRESVGAGLSLNHLTIAIDCANGAASHLAPRLFTSLGARVEVIHATPDGRNINLGCGSLHPESLQRAVTETGADLGIAFDGDADRLMLVDERGALLDGDHILFMLAEYLASRKSLTGNRVVATVMSNLGLELALAQRGIELARTSVGDKYVLDELLKGGGAIGGEQSGHIIFPEISLAGDGMITALEILRAAVETGRGVSQMAGGMTRLPQVILNVKVSRKPPLESIPEINEALSDQQGKLAGQGRILVRYSGTENIARIMIEGRDEAIIRQQAESLAQVLRLALN